MFCRVLVILLVFPGCGSQGRSDLLPVSGSVLHGDGPLTTGSVSFRPDAAKDNRSLDHPTGAIDRSGRYQLFTTGMPGAPPGWYKVVVNATEPTGDSGQASPGMPKSIIDLRYNSPDSSPLAIEVKPSPPAGHYDLRLDK